MYLWFLITILLLDFCYDSLNSGTSVEFFTVNRKLAEMSILASKDLTTAKK